MQATRLPLADNRRPWTRAQRADGPRSVLVPGYSCPSSRGSDECGRFGALGQKVDDCVLDTTSSRPEGEGPESAVLFASAAEGS